MELNIDKLIISLSRNASKSFKKFLDPDDYPNHPQNLISFSLYHFRHFLNISSKSVHKFLSSVVNKQTNKPCQKHNLLGGGKYTYSWLYIINIFIIYLLRYLHSRSVKYRTYQPPISITRDIKNSQSERTIFISSRVIDMNFSRRSNNLSICFVDDWEKRGKRFLFSFFAGRVS